MCPNSSRSSGVGGTSFLSDVGGQPGESRPKGRNRAARSTWLEAGIAHTARRPGAALALCTRSRRELSATSDRAGPVRSARRRAEGDQRRGRALFISRAGVGDEGSRLTSRRISARIEVQPVPTMAPGCRSPSVREVPTPLPEACRKRSTDPRDVKWRADGARASRPLNPSAPTVKEECRQHRTDGPARGGGREALVLAQRCARDRGRAIGTSNRCTPLSPPLHPIRYRTRGPVDEPKMVVVENLVTPHRNRRTPSRRQPNVLETRIASSPTQMRSMSEISGGWDAGVPAQRCSGGWALIKREARHHGGVELSAARPRLGLGRWRRGVTLHPNVAQ